LFGPQKGEPKADPDIPKREALNGFWKKIRVWFLILSNKITFFTNFFSKKCVGGGFPRGTPLNSPSLWNTY
jgi:hypothetical protein